MIKITEAAKQKIISILDENGSSMLRFGLQGGGCSGMQYNFGIVDVKDEDDLEYPLDEFHKVIVDCMSIMYLENAELDYVKDLMSETFTVHNPNSKSQCGCGSSFSID